MGRQSRNDFIGGKGTPQERKKRHARILLTFKEDNKLTQKTTDHFVDCVNFFARNIVDECANLFLDRLKKRGVDGDEIVREVKDDLEPLQKPFSGLETAWSQAAYFEEVFHSVVRLHKIDKFVCHLVFFRKVVGIKNICTLSLTALRTVLVMRTRLTRKNAAAVSTQLRFATCSQ